MEKTMYLAIAHSEAAFETFRNVFGKNDPELDKTEVY